MSSYFTTVPCEICARQTRMTGTKRCDECWQLERLIQANPAAARKILYALDGMGGKQQCSEVRHAGQCVLDDGHTGMHRFTAQDLALCGMTSIYHGVNDTCGKSADHTGPHSWQEGER